MDKKTLIEGIAVGAVAGAIAGLLLAPKSGKETRDEIKADLLEVKDTIVAKLEALEDFTRGEVRRGRQDRHRRVLGSQEDPRRRGGGAGDPATGRLRGDPADGPRAHRRRRGADRPPSRRLALAAPAARCWEPIAPP